MLLENPPLLLVDTLTCSKVHVLVPRDIHSDN
jgi:hypothetical protein